MRRFVVIGQRATASPGFSLVDIPGTSGRLDVLLRCLRAALLFSHGLRRDTVIYLVLLGGPEAPRTLRVDGGAARYLRPDERHLAVMVQKALTEASRARLAAQLSSEGLLVGETGEEAAARAAWATTKGQFVAVRPGIAVAEGGLEAVLADLGGAVTHVLEEGAPDLRERALVGDDHAFFLGDHLGFNEECRAALARIGAVPVSIGPVSLQADDVIAVVTNELDRREAARAAPDGSRGA
jgi:tRNA (pseudouridine54-N1)-methyltransferase